MKRNIRKKEIKNKNQEKTRDEQWNCSPCADPCPHSNLPMLANSPQFIY